MNKLPTAEKPAYMQSAYWENLSPADDRRSTMTAQKMRRIAELLRNGSTDEDGIQEMNDLASELDKEAAALEKGDFMQRPA
jgi:hypothetical protein